MLFYLALAVASLFAAVFCLWLFRSLYDVSHRVGDLVLPGARKSRKRRHQRMAHLNPSLEPNPSPWGWGRGDTLASNRPARKVNDDKPMITPAGKIPWGWPGNSHHDDDVLIQWPHRQDVGGSSVRHQAGFAGGGKKAGKPWGW